jgi:diguanylate cyclase (GGDEF)-like protein
MILPDGTVLRLSVSLGVAHAPEHASDLRELYAEADAALYSAKRGGRDRVGVPALLA